MFLVLSYITSWHALKTHFIYLWRIVDRDTISRVTKAISTALPNKRFNIVSRTLFAFKHADSERNRRHYIRDVLENFHVDQLGKYFLVIVTIDAAADVMEVVRWTESFFVVYINRLYHQREWSENGVIVHNLWGLLWPWNCFPNVDIETWMCFTSNARCIYIYRESRKLWTQLTSVLNLSSLTSNLVYLDKDFKYGSTRQPMVIYHHW